MAGRLHFRVNDIGFLRVRPNRNQANGYAEVGQPDPWKKFRRLWGFSSYSQGWTDEGLRIERYFETGVSFQLLNYWNFNGGGGRNGDAYDDLDTRGGPPIFTPGNNFMFFNANSDSRKSWRVNLGGNRWRDAVGGSQWVGLTVQPTDRVHRCPPATARGLTTRSGSSIRTPTVMALLITCTRSIDTSRCRPTCSPSSRSATTQTSGSLRCPTRICSRRSRSRTTRISIRSLRGNVVLRWEYVRGSTLFVVWDLSQADYSRPGVFRPWSDIGTAFGAEATHTLMVKVSYWIKSVTRGPVRTMPECLPAMSLLRRFGRTASNFSGAR